MTAKEFVLSKMPKANIETHQNGRGEYCVIRDDNNFFYFASGKNESEAWQNAKNKIEQEANENNNINQK